MLLEVKETLAGVMLTKVAVNGQLYPTSKVYGLGVRVTVHAGTVMVDVLEQVPPKLNVAVAVTVEIPVETPVAVVV